MPGEIPVEEISDDDSLLRRIVPAQIIRDQNTGRERPSSAAFKQLEMSVDCEEIQIKHGLDWNSSIREYPSCSLVKFFAKIARGLELPVLHRPLDGNPTHSEVHGKKTGSKADQLARSSEWVHRAA